MLPKPEPLIKPDSGENPLPTPAPEPPPPLGTLGSPDIGKPPDPSGDGTGREEPGFNGASGTPPVESPRPGPPPAAGSAPFPSDDLAAPGISAADFPTGSVVLGWPGAPGV
ncbi:hypothetical protein H7H69_11835 [Mycobacterium heckeshornense]|uniref:hypothetical protein n=1 Tax=Mycobacterium heckeshornense TaxID=110505 RepID=UPI0021F2E17E|nr:hypothetical protein [Mycobacterium heckeshornense]MCV7034883.1 hypothetical protein [Mycobacterium heckeshornense]